MLHHCPLDGSLFCPTAGKWSLIPLSLPLLSFSIKCPSPLCPCRTEKKGGRRKKNERVPLSKSMSREGGKQGPGPEHAAGQAVRASDQVTCPTLFSSHGAETPIGRPDTRDSTQMTKRAYVLVIISFALFLRLENFCQRERRMFCRSLEISRRAGKTDWPPPSLHLVGAQSLAVKADEVRPLE